MPTSAIAAIAAGLTSVGRLGAARPRDGAVAGEVLGTTRAPSASGRRCARRGTARSGRRHAMLVTSASCGTTRSVGRDGRDARKRPSATAASAPTICTTTNAGTLLGAMPANVFGERARDGDRGVGEARRRREPVRRRDVAADRERAPAGARPARTTPRITRSSPNVATTSPNQSAPDERACVETSTAGRSNMRLATIAPTQRADDLRDDVDDARRVFDMPPRIAVGQGDDRVEVRARDRAEREDQRDERRAGGDRVLEQLQADVVRATAAARRCPSRRRRRRGTRCRRLRRSRAARGRDRSPWLSSSAPTTRARSAQHSASLARVDGAQLARGPSRRRRGPCRSPTARRRGRRPRPCPAPRSSTRLRPRSAVASPSPARRAWAAATSSVDSTSTPRWFSDPGLAVALDQHQLQRRLGDGEVGVAGADLGRLGREELRVEVDRVVEVGHVQGELHPDSSGSLPDTLASVDGSMSRIHRRLSIDGGSSMAKRPTAVEPTPTAAARRSLAAPLAEPTPRTSPGPSPRSPTRCGCGC